MNVIFSRHLESFDFGFEAQKTITDFEIILAKDNRKEKVLLGSIKQETDRNISLFEEDEEHFDAAIKYLEEIEAHIKVTNDCGARLLETAALWTTFHSSRCK